MAGFFVWFMSSVIFPGVIHVIVLNWDLFGTKSYFSQEKPRGGESRGIFSFVLSYVFTVTRVLSIYSWKWN